MHCSALGETLIDQKHEEPCKEVAISVWENGSFSLWSKDVSSNGKKLEKKPLLKVILSGMGAGGLVCVCLCKWTLCTCV